MDSSNFLLVIIGVSLVTYPLRCIPAVFISRLHLSAFLQRFLDLVPYTAMTALVFPGIFYCIDGHTYAAYAGTCAAILSAAFKAPLALSVVIAVLTVLVMLII